MDAQKFEELRKEAERDLGAAVSAMTQLRDGWKDRIPSIATMTEEQLGVLADLMKPLDGLVKAYLGV